MKTKLLYVFPLVSLIVGCGQIPTLSEGPRYDEDISQALNEANFVNYVIQSNHKNEQLGNYFTVATISPLDMSFKTKTKQLLFTTEHSSYYFDKVDDSYDVYYKDKTLANKSYMGNSYYGRYNGVDKVEEIPSLDDVYTYYNVFNMASLDKNDFTYNTNLNGWYILNADAYQKIITDFFGYDESYVLNRFNLQVNANKVRSIEYELINDLNVKIKNEIFYTYPLDYLQDVQFSLINNVAVEKTEVPLVETMVSEETSSEDIATTSEIETSEQASTSETDSSSEPEPTTYVDKVNFVIYDDAKTFGTNRYTIASLQLFENYNYELEFNEPLIEITRGDKETVSERSLTLTRRLTRGKRYLLRVNLASSPDGGSSDYYDYSWIH